MISSEISVLCLCLTMWYLASILMAKLPWHYIISNMLNVTLNTICFLLVVSKNYFQLMYLERERKIYRTEMILPWMTDGWRSYLALGNQKESISFTWKKMSFYTHESIFREVSDIINIHFKINVNSKFWHIFISLILLLRKYSNKNGLIFL